MLHLAKLHRIISSLGPRAALRYKVAQHRHHARPYQLTSRDARFPLWVRPDTSDRAVFDQLFVDLEYACVAHPNPVHILDCGANVGYTSAYLLTRYPRARIVAVEPDPGNAAMLRRNLSPYGERVTIVEAGLWSHTVGLVMSTDRFRDGREWTRRVREVRPGEAPTVQAVDLNSLIQHPISILKMDIEGAETIVLRSPHPWLGRVDTLVVELHDAGARAAFQSAVQGRHVLECGELSIASRSVPSLTEAGRRQQSQVGRRT